MYISRMFFKKKGYGKLKYNILEWNQCGAAAQMTPSPEQGWGLLNQFPPFRYFPTFSE